MKDAVEMMTSQLRDDPSVGSNRGRAMAFNTQVQTELQPHEGISVAGTMINFKNQLTVEAH